MTSINWSSGWSLYGTLSSAAHRWRKWWMARTSPSCVHSCQRRTFWAFDLTTSTATARANFCLLIWWTLNQCYCVQYTRILLCLILCISQGSAVTHLRRGGKSGMSFVSNFIENTTVRELWKSANVCKRYEWMRSGTFLTLSVRNVT